MRYQFLLVAGLLAGCQSFQLPFPKSVPSEPKPSDPQAQVERSVELVNSKKVVGYRDFNNAKKVLPEIYAGMEEDFYCGCRYPPASE